MTERVVIGDATLYLGDALEVLPTLADNSVDLILTDPPYYKVKDEPWDRQWETPSGFLDWIGQLCGQWERVLKANGSLYVFASPRMAARVECKIGERFNVLNRIRWVKEEGWHKKADKDALRSYLSPWEEIIFAEHYGADNIAKGEATCVKTGRAHSGGQDAPGCGIGGTVSPDCPEHGGLYALAYMALCDEHAADGLSRIASTYARLVRGLIPFDVPSGLTGGVLTSSDNSGFAHSVCSDSATERSTQSHRMARVLSAGLPSWEAETMPSRIERMLARLAGRWIYADTHASNKHAVCLAARQWLENPCHTADTSWFSVSCNCPPPRNISHFAGNHKSGEQQYIEASDDLRGFIFEPLRAYLASEWERAGLTRADADAATSSFMSGHYLSQVQWMLPTREKYHQLRDYANNHNHGGEYLRREYEDLRREYEDLRREYEDLRRPFAVTADVPYTDVWTFPTVSAYPSKHPCEKPQAMMEHIIRASSRERAMVLDCFMGSGNVGRAALALGRSFIGIELAEHWHSIACQRIAAAQPQLRLPLGEPTP